MDEGGNQFYCDIMNTSEELIGKIELDGNKEYSVQCEVLHGEKVIGNISIQVKGRNKVQVGNAITKQIHLKAIRIIQNKI